MKSCQEVEHSLITSYRKAIWRPFMKAVMDYQLIKKGDRIAVCISGGKDSFLLAKCLEELQRHGKVAFELVYLVMDPGYQGTHLQKIKDNAASLGLPIQIVSSDIFAVANKLDKEHPCYLCARMRRGFLYQQAQEMGCNKIALGHHFDDVIETILLSMFYGGEFKTMLPKLHSTNFSQMELIRPLYLVKEDAIVSFWEKEGYQFINCACRFTSSKAATSSKRLEMKRLIASLRQNSAVIDRNIFKSSEKVNLKTILSYEQEGQTISFLDHYDEV